MARGRPKDDANPEAILAAAEALLAGTPLQHLRTAAIIERAGVARRTFYAYFPSKDAVAGELLRRVMTQVEAAIQPFVARDEHDAPIDALRRTVVSGARAWAGNRVVLRVAVENWHAVPELAEHWVGFTDAFAASIAAEIERQRAAGLAPAGHDAQELSAVLVQSTVQCLYLSGLDDVAALRDEHAITDAILAVWCGALYRT